MPAFADCSTEPDCRAVPLERPAQLQPAWLERFERLSLAAHGAVYDVWKVRRRVDGSECALKELRHDSPNPKVARQLLMNECEVTGRVTSDQVVSLVEACLDGDAPWLVFEWLDGESLESMLEGRGNLSCREALWFARQAAQGLRDLLQAGFTHGKMNAGNLFVCRSGLVKLINLGFSRQDDRVVDDLNARAPQSLEADVSPASAPAYFSATSQDLFGLGATLYRMLTGRTPFANPSPLSSSTGEAGLPGSRLRNVAPHVPAETAELVHRLLSRQPLRRATEPAALVGELIRLELQTLDSAG